MAEQGYRRLEIYRRGHGLAIRVHRMSLGLPKFELYEEGSQVRRSAKSIPSNIVEGYSLRTYKKEFMLFLNRAFASCAETIEHLEILFETGSLTEGSTFTDLRNEYESLSKMIFAFAQSVDRDHGTPHYLRETPPSTDETLFPSGE